MNCEEGEQAKAHWFHLHVITVCLQDAIVGRNCSTVLPLLRINNAIFWMVLIGGRVGTATSSTGCHVTSRSYRGGKQNQDLAPGTSSIPAYECWGGSVLDYSESFRQKLRALIVCMLGDLSAYGMVYCTHSVNLT